MFKLFNTFFKKNIKNVIPNNLFKNSHKKFSNITKKFINNFKQVPLNFNFHKLCKPKTIILGSFGLFNMTILSTLSNEKNNVQTFEYGETKEEFTLINNLKEGPYKLFQNNELIIECNYLNGKRHGKFIRYECGRPAVACYYNQGKLHNEYIEYCNFDNYQGIQKLCTYDNGILHGKFIENWSDGTLYKKGNYVNGKLHGRIELQKGGYENYENGVLCGKLRHCDCTGLVIKEGTFDKGRGCYKTYWNGKLKEVVDERYNGIYQLWDNGILIEEKNYKDQILEGKYYLFSTHYNKILELSNYKNGKKNGLSHTSNENSTSTYTIQNYDNDVLNGPSTTYVKNKDKDVPIIQCHYKNGKLHGNYKRYSHNYSLIELEYNEGEIVAVLHNYKWLSKDTKFVFQTIVDKDHFLMIKLLIPPDSLRYNDVKGTKIEKAHVLQIIDIFGHEYNNVGKFTVGELVFSDSETTPNSFSIYPSAEPHYFFKNK